VSLKLISLNIEGHKHLDKIIPFLQQEQPDVVCMMEVFEEDVATFKTALGMEGQFVPLKDVPEPDEYFFGTGRGPWGLLQLSRLPAKEQTVHYYVKSGETVPLHDHHSDGGTWRAVAASTYQVNGQDYTIATLHFVVSEKGQTSSVQLQHLELLFKTLEQFPELVMCGDFNAPRGKEVFDQLAARYKDNIPLEYTFSLDPVIHRSGPLPFMVDGMFSTPEYQISQVRLQDGVSDHLAIVAQVERVK